MVRIEKQTLKLLTLNFIEGLDENSTEFERASEILLILLGVSDAEGNLTEGYSRSGYWTGGNDGTPLRISNKTDIKYMLPTELHGLFNATK